jgi:PPOX class probable F420-dependent enzyme
MTAKVPDEFRDLLDAPVATLATIGQDGWPQVTAVAFVHDKDDDLVKVSLNDTRQKTKNLRREPHTTLFILDPATPYRTLEIRARAEPRDLGGLLRRCSDTLKERNARRARLRSIANQTAGRGRQGDCPHTADRYLKINTLVYASTMDCTHDTTP